MSVHSFVAVFILANAKANILVDVDVAIVGAGYAGLSAARDLHAAGISFRILEANDRVGGRTLSYNLSAAGIGSGTLDLGGEWLDAQQIQPSAWRLIVDELGFKPILFENANHSGDSLMYTTEHPAGIRAGSTVKLLQAVGFKTSIEVLWIFEELTRLKWLLPVGEKRLDNMTFEAWLDEHRLSAAAHEVVRNIIGSVFTYAEPWQYSALEVVSGVGGMEGLKTMGGKQYTLQEGYDAPARSMASALQQFIHLSTPVTAIVQTAAGALVVGDRPDGESVEVHAKRVLYSGTPHTSLKVNFTPPMSRDRRDLYEKLPMGNFAKLQVVYSRPFWEDMGLTGDIINFVDPEHSPGVCVPNPSPGSKMGVIMCSSEGDFGVEIMNKTVKQRQDIVTSFLARSFGLQAKEPLLYMDHDWTAEPYIQGACNPVYTPGVMTTNSRLLAEDFMHVTWIGTDVSIPLFGPQSGFVDGAIKSGRAAAKRIIDDNIIQVQV